MNSRPSRSRVLIGILSIQPTVNMLSSRQLMNFSYNPLQLVNTYGAFGSVTRTRYEVVVEGTADALPGPATKWREYEFKGKPTDPMRRPPQIAPYHLRLDWMMWFAAMSQYTEHPWFVNFAAKLLQGDRAVLGLLRDEPFSRPPAALRARQALRVPLHHARGEGPEQGVVEAQAGGAVVSGGIAGQPGLSEHSATRGLALRAKGA